MHVNVSHSLTYSLSSILLIWILHVQLNLYKKVEQIFCVAHLNELRFPFLKGKIKFDGAHSYEIPLDGSQSRQPNNQVLLSKKSGISHFIW